MKQITGAWLASLMVAAVMTFPAMASAEVNRGQVEKQLRSFFHKMRQGTWTARMTGCGGRSECNEATVHFRLPGRINIQYDRPYGSRSVSDGEQLYVYNNSGNETARRALALMLTSRRPLLGSSEEETGTRWASSSGQGDSVSSWRPVGLPAAIAFASTVTSSGVNPSMRITVSATSK